jgi:hypothetical protein
MQIGANMMRYTSRALSITIWVVGLLLGGSSAIASEAASDAGAKLALTRLFAALASGDAAQIRPLIGPGFQVQRSDGVGYDRETYLARSVPHVRSTPQFNDLVVTADGDIVVTRFRLEVDETIDGRMVEVNAPQLIVFRVTGTEWRVIAAANFAQLTATPGTGSK